jgi:hypothetical protein
MERQKKTEKERERDKKREKLRVDKLMTEKRAKEKEFYDMVLPIADIIDFLHNPLF